MTLLLVDVGFGGTVTDPDDIPWVDIHRYVDLETGVSIQRGASDELSDIQPATCSLTLDNLDGRFTADLSTSPYAPNVVMNTPIRIAVATMDAPSGAAPWPLGQLCDDFDDDRINASRWTVAGSVTETGGRIRIPAAAGVTSSLTSTRQWTLTGSFTTVRVSTAPAPTGASTCTASFMVNAVTAGTRIGFIVNTVAGTLQCRSEVGGSDAGATSDTWDPVGLQYLRIRETSGTVYWEASSDGFGWFVLRSISTPSWVGTNQVTLQLAATRTGGTTTFAEFDLVGAVVHPRFFGMVNEWPSVWEGLLSKVTITATDMFKWLNLQPELRALLTEEILLLGPVSYYPMAEPEGSTSVGDLSGATTTALALAQAGSGGTLAFSGADGPPATGQQCPVFTPASASAGRYLTADLGMQFARDTGVTPVVVEAWFRTTTAGRTVCALRSTDNAYRIAVGLDGTGKLQVVTAGPSTGTVTATFTTPNLADDAWHQVVYNETGMEIYVDGTQYGPITVATSHDLRRLSVGSDFGATLWSGAIAHVAVYTLVNSLFVAIDASDHYEAGSTGYAGEPADFRIERLGYYSGMSTATALGFTFDPVASQGPGGARALDMMKAVETTEGAKLFADRDWAGVSFQSRDLRYNPTPEVVLSYVDLVTAEIEASLDDQKMINTVVASRPGGATQRVVDQASRARYGPKEKSLDILKTSDNSVLDAANWLVSRYANPRGEIREVPIEAYSMGTAMYRDLLDLGLSGVITVTDLPAQSATPEQTLFIEGYTEDIHSRTHRIQFHTSRSVNDSVWVLDDPLYSVLGSTTRLAY
ncbi:LamG-like jellyroll fold domain-containing protein [Streptomyces sp. NPDC088732]|uniref:LamG-like jellyroll fold domain-containing protein n=1 Tax=Streptomyces sp. NPDC088732 TaxID=3365879 RepID=UPI00381B7132